MKAIHNTHIGVAAGAHGVGLRSESWRSRTSAIPTSRASSRPVRRSNRRSAPAIRPFTTRSPTRTIEPGVEVFGLESYSALNNFNLGHARRDSASADQQRHRRAVDLQRVHARSSKEARLVVNAMDALERSDQGRQDDRHDGQGSPRAVVRILRRRRFARVAGNDLRLGGDRRTGHAERFDSAAQRRAGCREGGDRDARQRARHRQQSGGGGAASRSKPRG